MQKIQYLVEKGTKEEVEDFIDEWIDGIEHCYSEETGVVPMKGPSREESGKPNDMFLILILLAQKRTEESREIINRNLEKILRRSDFSSENKYAMFIQLMCIPTPDGYFSERNVNSFFLHNPILHGTEPIQYDVGHMRYLFFRTTPCTLKKEKAMIHAISNGMFLREMVEVAEVDPNDEVEEFRSALHYAFFLQEENDNISLEQQEKTIRTLVELGADLNNGGENNPLMSYFKENRKPRRYSKEEIRDMLVRVTLSFDSFDADFNYREVNDNNYCLSVENKEVEECEDCISEEIERCYGCDYCSKLNTPFEFWFPRYKKQMEDYRRKKKSI